jgi:predicted nucleic acid-binding protein
MENSSVLSGARKLSIGPSGLLIAATALTNDRILVTANTSEFDRAPDLVIEN